MPLAAAPVIAQSAPIPLIPPPREVVRGVRVSITSGLAVTHTGSADDAFTARDLAASLAERWIRVDTVTTIGRYRVERIRRGSARAKGVMRAMEVGAMRAETP